MKAYYDKVEVGYPSEWEDLLIPYRDKSELMIAGERPKLYVNVPAQVVRAVIAKHAGMATRSGHLPRMVEVGEDGVLWAEAAIPPSDSSMDTTGGSEHAAGTQSPFSTIHMGAPPPLPPATAPPARAPTPTQTTTPMTPITGALTPPMTMRRVTISPIEITHENFDE